MSKHEKHARDMSREEYAAARRYVTRDRPMPPSDERPLQSPAKAMTPEQYNAAKRDIVRK